MPEFDSNFFGTRPPFRRDGPAPRPPLAPGRPPFLPRIPSIPNIRGELASRFTPELPTPERPAQTVGLPRLRDGMVIQVLERLLSGERQPRQPRPQRTPATATTVPPSAPRPAAPVPALRLPPGLPMSGIGINPRFALSPIAQILARLRTQASETASEATSAQGIPAFVPQSRPRSLEQIERRRANRAATTERRRA